MLGALTVWSGSACTLSVNSLEPLGSEHNLSGGEAESGYPSAGFVLTQTPNGWKPVCGWVAATVPIPEDWPRHTAGKKENQSVILTDAHCLTITETPGDVRLPKKNEYKKFAFAFGEGPTAALMKAPPANAGTPRNIVFHPRFSPDYLEETVPQGESSPLKPLQAFQGAGYDMYPDVAVVFLNETSANAAASVMITDKDRDLRVVSYNIQDFDQCRQTKMLRLSGAFKYRNVGTELNDKQKLTYPSTLLMQSETSTVLPGNSGSPLFVDQGVGFPEPGSLVALVWGVRNSKVNDSDRRPNKISYATYLPYELDFLRTTVVFEEATHPYDDIFPFEAYPYLLNLLKSEAEGAGILKAKLASGTTVATKNRFEHNKLLTIGDYKNMVQAVLGFDEESTRTLLPDAHTNENDTLTEADILYGLARGLDLHRKQNAQKKERLEGVSLRPFSNIDALAEQTRNNLQEKFPDDAKTLFLGRIAAAVDTGVVVSYPDPTTLFLTSTATRGWTLMTLHQVRTLDPTTLTLQRDWKRLSPLTSRWAISGR